MTTTIIGLLGDRLGLACHAWLEPGRNIPQLRRSYSAIPGGEYRSRQRPDLSLELDHESVIGKVRHLERNRDGDLWLVGEITASPATIPADACYLSPDVTYTTEDGSSVARDIQLHSVSLVSHPATAGARSVTELNGDLRQASRDIWRLRNPFLTGLLEHACANTAGTATIWDNRPRPVEVVPGLYLDHRGDPIPTGSSGKTTRLPDGSHAEVEYRPATILGVR